MRQRSEEETHSVTEGTLSKKTKRSWRLSSLAEMENSLALRNLCSDCFTLRGEGALNCRTEDVLTDKARGTTTER